MTVSGIGGLGQVAEASPTSSPKDTGDVANAKAEDKVREAGAKGSVPEATEGSEPNSSGRAATSDDFARALSQQLSADGAKKNDVPDL